VMRNMSMLRLSSWKLTGSYKLSMTFNLALPTSTLSQCEPWVRGDLGVPDHGAIAQRDLEVRQLEGLGAILQVDACGEAGEHVGARALPLLAPCRLLHY